MLVWGAAVGCLFGGLFHIRLFCLISLVLVLGKPRCEFGFGSVWGLCYLMFVWCFWFVQRGWFTSDFNPYFVC